MAIVQLPDPLTVISPHLDDAVFSCGALIAASRNAVVVTVLAGMPDASLALTEWDRAAGFSSVTQAVTHRRSEDACSLGLLGAQAEWLDLLDGQYDARHTAQDIMTGLATSAALQRGGTVVAPMGLFHSDHILVGQACMLLRAVTLSLQSVSVSSSGPGDGPMAPSVKWLFYEDAIYRRMPGILQRRLLGWWQDGLIAQPLNFPQTPWQQLKMAAVEAYESQLPLFDADGLADIYAPERYWTLDFISASRIPQDIWV